MKAVWKYQMPKLVQRIPMPEGSQILRVGEQHGVPTMWVLVDPNAPNVDRYFELIVTGHEFNSADRSYVGTAQLEGGNFVVHVFEVTP